jgi:RNA polymerase sigma-70 factor, ECF subfamily
MFGKSMSIGMKFETETRTDFALVHAAKEGNEAAFEKLVRRHTRRMFRIALLLTKCQEDAEEVVQDVFVKAFTNLYRFEERAQFSTWLTRIAINTALMRVRSRSRYRTVSLSQDEQSGPEIAPEQIADWRPDPEQLYSRLELKQILIQALDSLPDHYRTIFLLRDIEGFSITETAELLDLSDTAVKARLTRARLQLRARLNAHFRGDGQHAQSAAHRESLLVKLTSLLGRRTQAADGGCGRSSSILKESPRCMFPFGSRGVDSDPDQKLRRFYGLFTLPLACERV